jgi:hypothetical protein
VPDSKLYSIKEIKESGHRVIESQNPQAFELEIQGPDHPIHTSIAKIPSDREKLAS